MSDTEPKSPDSRPICALLTWVARPILAKGLSEMDDYLTGERARAPGFDPPPILIAGDRERALDRAPEPATGPGRRRPAGGKGRAPGPLKPSRRRDCASRIECGWSARPSGSNSRLRHRPCGSRSMR